jgi:hypothetical protein
VHAVAVVGMDVCIYKHGILFSMAHQLKTFCVQQMC